ncbi:unnamed protein product [Gongylonema pulchrum]|uniref:Uncharacterized protein n=1 Tax=Gongylonema pulchrum TaxID=637853 RepID=A0A183D4K5_9BILA|nr:unnamed protein product [Gongylonema pulchrum]
MDKMLEQIEKKSWADKFTSELNRQPQSCCKNMYEVFLPDQLFQARNRAEVDDDEGEAGEGEGISKRKVAPGAEAGLGAILSMPATAAAVHQISPLHIHFIYSHFILK